MRLSKDNVYLQGSIPDVVDNCGTYRNVPFTLFDAIPLYSAQTANNAGEIDTGLAAR
jgi:hypothetical protein